MKPGFSVTIAADAADDGMIGDVSGYELTLSPNGVVSFGCESAPSLAKATPKWVEAIVDRNAEKDDDKYRNICRREITTGLKMLRAMVGMKQPEDTIETVVLHAGDTVLVKGKAVKRARKSKARRKA